MTVSSVSPPDRVRLEASSAPGGPSEHRRTFDRLRVVPGVRLLLGLGVVHLALALVLVLLLAVPAEPVLGVHPALKPFKFALSIGTYLVTMALVVPQLTLTDRGQLRLARVLAATMIVEMVAIALQALRGTTSHFNTSTLFDLVLWQAMGGAIGVMTLAMIVVFWIALGRPLRGFDGGPAESTLALAVRAGLGLFLLAAVTGFTMGNLMRHTVGGADGGPGLPLLNWSTTVGDLRISHFFSVHAIQVLPLLALGGLVLGLGPRAQRALVWGGGAAYSALCVGTFVQALRGLPLL